MLALTLHQARSDTFFGGLKRSGFRAEQIGLGPFKLTWTPNNLPFNDFYKEIIIRNPKKERFQVGLRVPGFPLESSACEGQLRLPQTDYDTGLPLLGLA